MIVFAGLSSGLIIGGLLGFAICILLISSDDGR